jgi:ABC-2 type transport system ATP-binding protein
VRCADPGNRIHKYRAITSFRAADFKRREQAGCRTAASCLFFEMGLNEYLLSTTVTGCRWDEKSGRLGEIWYMTFAIAARGLKKVYKGSVEALAGVDLDVKAGDIFALLGPNGAGKTTLMRILTTQFKPTSGEAHIFGLDVVHEGAEVRKVIGYVPQETSVWSDINGYENLLIYAKIFGLPSGSRKEVIYDMLESMGLRAVAGQLVKNYSGGMIRKLEIACAMLIRPKILFLDEPTLGLDPAARIAVWEKLTSFKEEFGTTVFFSTHYMDEANAYSDELAIINMGRMVTSGTAEDLKHSLRGELIKFSLSDRRVDERTLARIRGLERVNSVVVTDSTLNVTVEDAETALPGVMDVLRSGEIPVVRIATTKPTLDDVFLRYAGTTRGSDAGARTSGRVEGEAGGNRGE